MRYLYLILVCLGLTSCGINSIPTMDEEVKASWSQVLNQYKRRADLIPNLVSTVKGYSSHEKETFIAVTEARSKVSQIKLPENILSNPEAFKQFQASQDQLGQSLSRLMVVAERYPDLKADKNFLALQSQLEGTENRISVARRDYISAVKKYNTELRTIPGRWWASLMYPDAKVKENFSQPVTIEETPEVKF